MHELNEEINDKEIRLIGSEGEQLGIMPPAEALKIADEQGLDLVKISPQANPPVCKLMNYGKFRFEQSKREKEARKNQHVVEIKEIRMSPGIDIGDFNTKLKNAQKYRSSSLTATASRSRSASAAGRWPTPTSAGTCWTALPHNAPKPPTWTNPPSWRDG